MIKRYLTACLALALFAASTTQAQVQATLEFVGEFGEFGFYTGTFPPNAIPPTGFNQPRGLDFLTGQRLLIADYGNNKLQSCDLAGEDCQWIGSDGSGFGRNVPGVFDRPHGVEVREDGRFAVADEDNHAVQLCTASGNCIYRGDNTTADNKPSSGLGRWAFPNDVSIDSESRVFGLDTENNRIQVLRPDNLNVLDTFLSAGSAPGQVSLPRGLAIDAEDRIIIADTGNHRIQVCDADANCTAFGGQGTAPGAFNNPVGVDVDALGRIWVADTGNNRIQACSYGGDCIAFGSGGGYSFLDPHDVAVHPSGTVAVADTGNNRIRLFATEASFRVNPGLNDAWYDPATAGQGFFFTLYPDRGEVFVANFTFDSERPPEDITAILGDPGHRWLTAYGAVEGTSANLAVTLTADGLFDSSTPPVNNTTPYGSYEIEFLGCDRIRLSYDLPAIPQRGTIVLERVARDNVALCEALSADG